MSDHDMMNHEGHTPSDDQTPQTGKLEGFLKSQAFRIAVIAVVLVVGLLLARRLRIGGNLLAGIGIFAFMMFGQSLMHGRHGSQGGHGSHGGHGGCGGSSHSGPQHTHESNDRAAGSRDTESEPRSEKDSATAEPPQRHQGCH
jgi:hypothetical protein